MGRRSLLAVASAVVALAVGAAGCASRDDGAASATTSVAPVEPPALELDGATYVVADPLPDGGPGTVVGAEAQEPVDALGGARRTRFLYLSEDAGGTTVPVSGVLLVADGPAPAGGFPVVSWGHGTTGVADVCAPSTTDNLFYNEYAQEARTMLDAGYAVVATDYPGLGTPGGHAYLAGVEEGNAMVDAVTAARHLDDSLGTRWFAVGHSQGGAAALFATRAAARDRELDLAGAVSIAPASGLEAALPAIAGGEIPADIAYGTYVLAGLAEMDPSVRLEDELGPAGLEELDLITTDGCLLDLAPRLPVDRLGEVFDLTPERAAELSARVAAYGNPEQAATVGPVLVVQGVDDTDVPVGLTQNLVRRLQALGSAPELREYPGLGHDTVLGPSVCDRLAWMAARGGPAVPGCTPYETDMS